MRGPRRMLVVAALAASCSFDAGAAEPETDPGRTTRLGIYVTALRFRFPQNEFDADFWVWAAEPAAEGDWNPLDTLEVVDAREVQVRYRATLERTPFGAEAAAAGAPMRWHTQKVSATLPSQWDVHNYPFDRQTLSIRLEESVEDISGVVYVPDLRESGLAEELEVEGWTVSDLRLEAGVARYDTTFGDPALPEGSGSGYTRVTASLDIERDSVITFWKLTAGVYVAFLIAALSFYFDPRETSLTNPRINMLVGSLFAIMVNFRVAESSVGSAESFTLVDRVHIVTLLFLYVAAVMTVISRVLVESGRHSLARRIDRQIAFWAFSVSYLVLNVWMISEAAWEG